MSATSGGELLATAGLRALQATPLQGSPSLPRSTTRRLVRRSPAAAGLRRTGRLGIEIQDAAKPLDALTLAHGKRVPTSVSNVRSSSEATAVPIMSQILTLRPTRADDQEFLYRLFYSVHSEKLRLGPLGEEEKTKLVELMYQGFIRHYSSLAPVSDDRLILLNNESIGRMILLQTREEIRLADLAILPEYRQRGIGSALIGQVQTESMMSKRPVRLQVAQFDRALGLYRRLGFYKTDVEGPYIHLEWLA
jgi:GNAT superfamily N-acetyltransferase